MAKNNAGLVALPSHHLKIYSARLELVEMQILLDDDMP